MLIESVHTKRLRLCKQLFFAASSSDILLLCLKSLHFEENNISIMAHWDFEKINEIVFVKKKSSWTSQKKGNQTTLNLMFQQMAGKDP